MWFFSHRYRLAYLNVPKAACSTIRFQLMLLERPEELRRIIEEAPEAPAKAARRYVRENLDVLRPSEKLPEGTEDFLRFSFVRHPVHRLASAYLNKIVMWREEGRMVGFDAELFERRYAPGGFEPGMSFERFVERLDRAPARLVNGHFRPQTFFLLREGRLQVSFLGKVESMESHLQRLMPEEGLGHRRSNFLPDKA